MGHGTDPTTLHDHTSLRIDPRVAPGMTRLPSLHFLVVPLPCDPLDRKTSSTRFPPPTIPVPPSSWLTRRYPYLALLTVRMSATDPSSAPRPDPDSPRCRNPWNPEEDTPNGPQVFRTVGGPGLFRWFVPLPGILVPLPRLRGSRGPCRSRADRYRSRPGSHPLVFDARRTGVESLISSSSSEFSHIVLPVDRHLGGGGLGPPVIPFPCWCHPGHRSPLNRCPSFPPQPGRAGYFDVC